MAKTKPKQSETSATTLGGGGKPHPEDNPIKPKK